MAYNDLLAFRLRDALGAVPVVEKRMMGGLIFMINGHMVAGLDCDVEGRGRFMFRVGPVAMADALRRPGATPVRMGERIMKGFVFVSEDQALKDLEVWVQLARAFVGSLPPK